MAVSHKANNRSRLEKLLKQQDRWRQSIELSFQEALYNPWDSGGYCWHTSGVNHEQTDKLTEIYDYYIDSSYVHCKNCLSHCYQIIPLTVPPTAQAATRFPPRQRSFGSPRLEVLVRHSAPLSCSSVNESTPEPSQVYSSMWWTWALAGSWMRALNYVTKKRAQYY